MISALKKSVCSSLEALSEKPFYRLLRHCVDRMFYDGAGSRTGEVDASIGIILAILAAPGAFVSLALFSKYGAFFLWFRAYYSTSRTRSVRCYGAERLCISIHSLPLCQTSISSLFFRWWSPPPWRSGNGTGCCPTGAIMRILRISLSGAGTSSLQISPRCFSSPRFYPRTSTPSLPCFSHCSHAARAKSSATRRSFSAHTLFLLSSRPHSDFSACSRFWPF